LPPDPVSHAVRAVRFQPNGESRRLVSRRWRCHKVQEFDQNRSCPCPRTGRAIVAACAIPGVPVVLATRTSEATIFRRSQTHSIRRAPIAGTTCADSFRATRRTSSRAARRDSTHGTAPRPSLVGFGRRWRVHLPAAPRFAKVAIGTCSPKKRGALLRHVIPQHEFVAV
jgi:hypothetical protein